MPKGYCELAGCERPAARSSRCWAHLKRKARGQPLSPPVGPPVTQQIDARGRLLEAGIRWLDADTEDDREWERAQRSFEAAAENWLRSRGWHPPPVDQGEAGAA